MSIIEIIVAMAVFIIMAAVSVTSVIGSSITNRLSNQQTEATLLAQEGLEAARSIKNQGWETEFLGTSCSTGCGISSAGGSWEWLGASNTVGLFNRTITVSDVLRNGSGEIVTSGGTDDPDTKKVTAVVSWNASPTRPNEVSLSTYLTYFEQLITPLIGDWTQPSQSGVVNISGNDDALQVSVRGDYAYLVRSAGNPRFSVINITNPATPVQVGSLAISNRSPTNLFVSGNYAYLVGTQNTNELSIIDITNPASPSEVGVYNTAGNSDARGVYVVGSTAYVTTVNSGSPELYILNVTNPASPALLGSLNLNGNINRIVVNGNYAYVTSNDNSQEVQVISVSNPASPSLAATVNLPGNTDATPLSVIGDYLYTAQGSTVQVISIANPLAPSLVESLAVGGGNIDNISLESAGTEEYVFLATYNNSAEFAVLSITDPLNISIAGTVNVTGNNPLRGVSYSTDYDLVVGVGNSNSQEVIIFTPN